jgi:hypothetical protein
MPNFLYAGKNIFRALRYSFRISKNLMDIFLNERKLRWEVLYHHDKFGRINTTMWKYTKNKQTNKQTRSSCMRSYHVCLPECPSMLYHTTEHQFNQEYLFLIVVSLCSSSGTWFPVFHSLRSRTKAFGSRINYFSSYQAAKAYGVVRCQESHIF